MKRALLTLAFVLTGCGDKAPVPAPEPPRPPVRTHHSETPVKVDGIAGAITAVAAGATHSCAIAGGKVWCWGDNLFGELGIASDTPVSLSPRPVSGLDDVVSIAAGEHFTCALRENGKVFCWGLNSHGQLGNRAGNCSPAKDVSCSRVPISVARKDGGRLDKIRQISAQQRHACATDENGGVTCWGKGVRQVSLPKAIAVAAGEKQSCALTVREISCFGVTDTFRLEGPWAAMAMTSDDVVALEDSGKVFQWRPGDNLAPRELQGVFAKKVFGGWGKACVLTEGSELRCWAGSEAPERMPSLDGTTQAALGELHACALKSGEAWCWGANFSGQLGIGER